MQIKVTTVGVFIYFFGGVSIPACMFSSSTARFTWISMQIKVTTVGVFIYFFFFWSVYLHACFLARQLDLPGFQCRLK